VRRGTARPAANGEALSGRECQALQLAANGSTTREIARTLLVSPACVKDDFKLICAKLDVRDRPAAVAYGLRHGLIR
jgi:DNA-binding NarL/FixJ family response regulator